MTQHPFAETKCLVTGGVGFLGSHLCRALREQGAQVIVMDREPPQAGTLFPLLNAATGIDVRQCDLSEPESIREVQYCQPDYVFHLAGLPYAPYTSQHPGEADAANVAATQNALEGARLSPNARFVLASSACVFGATQKSPLRVDSPQSDPEHYYTITKREAERHVREAHRVHGLKASICRFGNIYGPGDRHFGRIVPQMCAQLIKEGRDTLELKRSQGDGVFEFLHVDDAVSGLLAAAAHVSPDLETWHFSGGESSRVSVIDLARRMSRLYDGREREVRNNRSSPEKRVVKYLDCSATAAKLGWTPSWTLDQGLRGTLDWYCERINSLAPHLQN